MAKQKSTENVFGHVAAPPGSPSVGPGHPAVRGKAGLGNAQKVSGGGTAAESQDNDPFYGPWIAPGLRIELKAIPGVTDKGLLDVPFRFQCPPLDTFHVDMAVGANDYATIQEGTFTNLSGMELATVTFDTIFVIHPAPWVIARGLWDPNNVTQRLQHIIKAESPMRIVAWHAGPVVELNMKVTMRTLGREERGGENDARYVTPSFTQWRDPVIRRRTKKTWPRYHELKGNESLADLAQQYWGKPSEAHYIGMVNDGLGKWGNRTPIIQNKHYDKGDTVMIPEPPELAVGPARALGK